MVEAIGLVELESIAAGVEVSDAMVKAAQVEYVDTFMVTPGRFVVLVHGDPSSVQASVTVGRELAGNALVDWLLIPFIDPQVFGAIRGGNPVEAVAALGLVETSGVAAGIVAADAAAKAAAVRLVQLHLGRGIGGKSILTLTGALPDVQAAVEAGSRQARDAGRLVATRVIPQPHPDLAARLVHGLQRLALPPPAAVGGLGAAAPPDTPPREV